MTLGEALKHYRKAAKLSQSELGEIVGIKQAMISHIELGIRGVEQSPDIVERLEKALNLAPGELAKHLPEEHPARRMTDAQIPILGIVSAGPGSEEPAEPGETVRVNDAFLGCVAYRVRGYSMIPDAIMDGDLLIVSPQPAPLPGTIVVAWLASDGAVVKRLSPDGRLTSSGSERWYRTLGDGDHIYGSLAGVLRICKPPQERK